MVNSLLVFDFLGQIKWAKSMARCQSWFAFLLLFAEFEQIHAKEMVLPRILFNTIDGSNQASKLSARFGWANDFSNKFV
jgi:hypothetical protein